MKIFSVFLLLMPLLLNAQVGIGGTSPAGTFDVTALPGSFPGVIPPRVTVAQLQAKSAAYGTAQIGVMVYVTDNNTARLNDPMGMVRSAGYYYFNGTRWIPLATPRSYLGSTTFNDMSFFGGTVNLLPAGSIVSSSKVTAGGGNDVTITHNKNFTGEQYIKCSYSTNVNASIAQLDADNELTEPLIHDITANSFKVYISENSGTAQNVSIKVEMTSY